MATSSSAEGVGSSPQTCCATCGTVFEVAPELLASSDTRVRCGECFAIFDARANLLPRGERPGDFPDGRPGDAGVRFETESDGAGGGRARVDAEGRARSGAAARGRAGGSGEGGAGSVAVFPAGRAANAHRDAGESSELDVTYSDFDLFSEDADLPDVAYFDQTRDTPDFDFDSVALEQDETFSDTLFVNDVTIDAGALPATVRAPELPELPGTPDAPLRAKLEVVGPDGPREPLAFAYKDPVSVDGPADERGPAARPAHDAPASGVPGADETAIEAPEWHDARRGTDTGSAATAAGTRGASDVASGGSPDGGFVDLGGAPVDLGLEAVPVRRRRWPVVLMVLALCVLLAGLHGWRVRDAPGRDPFVRPVWVAWCRVTGCEVPALAAIDRLRMVKREMFSHPRIADALVIDVAFRNEAPFDQPYPVLVVQLSNPSGKLVARRAFTPDEYLPNAGPDAGRDAGPNAGPKAGPDAGRDGTPGGATDGSSTGEGAGSAATLAAGALLDISLEVTDPGQDASSFTVEFRES